MDIPEHTDPLQGLYTGACCPPYRWFWFFRDHLKSQNTQWQENQNLSSEQENKLIEMILEVQNSSDFKEGQKAFSEKRKPVYSGK